MWQYLDAFLTWVETREEPPPAKHRSIITYRSKLNQFHTWIGADVPTPARLHQWREYLLTEQPGRTGTPGQRPRTVKQSFVALKLYFDWLRTVHNLQLPDPGKVRKPRINPGDHGASHVPTEIEVETLFRTADAMPVYTLPERYLRAQCAAVLSLAADCALRRCEILGLDLGDVRRKAADGPPVRVVIRKGKGEVHREVDLNARAQARLGAFLAVRQQWCDHQPDRHRNLALFPVDRSRRMNRDTIQRLRHRLLQAAGLEGKGIRLHDFRHYRITEWMGVNGVNPATVADLAGHADVATTLVYSHPREAERRRAISRSAGGSQAGEPERRGSLRRRAR